MWACCSSQITLRSIGHVSLEMVPLPTKGQKQSAVIVMYIFCTYKAGLGLKIELPQITSARELVKLGMRPQLAKIRHSYCANGCFLRDLSGDCQFAMLASRISAHLTAGTSRLHEQPMASTSSSTSFASPLHRQQLAQSSVRTLQRMTRHQRYGSCRPLSITNSRLLLSSQPCMTLSRLQVKSISSPCLSRRLQPSRAKRRDPIVAPWIKTGDHPEVLHLFSE